MTIMRKAYIAYQEACGFEEGDLVKVVGKAESRQGGWAWTWAPQMDACVGKTFCVLDGDAENAYEGGIRLDTGEITDGLFYWFPAFVLELVEKAPKKKEWETITLDGVEYEVRRKETDHDN